MTKIILETCGFWDIDYNSNLCDMTLDSIHNSCDVFIGTWFGYPADFLREGQGIEYQLVESIHELLFSPLTFMKKMQDHVKLLCLIEFL